MVFKITFEADVPGIQTVTRVNGEMYVYAKDGATARHFAESEIAVMYSDTYAILEVLPLNVWGLE